MPDPPYTLTMAKRAERKIQLTTYFEATADAARQSDDYPWFPALLGLVAATVVAALLVAWLA